MARKVKDQNT